MRGFIKMKSFIENLQMRISFGSNYEKDSANNYETVKECINFKSTMEFNVGKLIITNEKFDSDNELLKSK